MKLKAIRVSGFRGIPPHEEPDVALNIPSSGGQPRDLLIFGPNAYGKSSIADALDWFFKERSRNAMYYTEYQDQDNVHLNLGKPGCRDTAFIELDVLHGGREYTIRKELDANGGKHFEDLADIEQVVHAVEDEVIVLDHDRFRNFVAAANNDKWATFASLIGFEELDHFRAGLESLFYTRSLNDRLRFNSHTSSVQQKQRECSNLKSRVAEALNMPDASVGLDVYELAISAAVARLIVDANLPMTPPASYEAIDDQLWSQILSGLRESENLRQATENLAQLSARRTALAPFSPDELERLARLRQAAQELASYKDQFDRQLLDDLYQTGLQVIETGQGEQDQCPLCGAEQTWQELAEFIRERQSALAFEEIRRRHGELSRQWATVKASVTNIRQRVGTAGSDQVQRALQMAVTPSTLERAFALSSFEDEAITEWVTACFGLHRVLVEEHETLDRAVASTQLALNSDPFGELRSRAFELRTAWQELQSLERTTAELERAQQKLESTRRLIATAGSLATRFRDELNDFSARVVEHINADVARYYECLHFDDAVKPYLNVQVQRGRREVNLLCDYKGIPGKAAVTLLSESHRNSLGLAIFLAFIKFKRQTGSPVEFCVLDDVTQSFDTGHRASLLRLLEDPEFPEISDQQFIFLTHDRTLADFICRLGDTNNKNWHRYDIVDWQLHGMRIEPYANVDLIARALDHLESGDELAAAIYGRHALEWTLRSIAEKANLPMPYTSKPWNYKIEQFIESTNAELKRHWAEEFSHGARMYRRGIIDPARLRTDTINQGIRILHLTVHDSDFLENPPSAGDIRTAIQAVTEMRNMFTCPTCRAKTPAQYVFLTKLVRSNQGVAPTCSSCKCEVNADLP